jgi:hypothetical protein
MSSIRKRARVRGYVYEVDFVDAAGKRVSRGSRSRSNGRFGRKGWRSAGDAPGGRTSPISSPIALSSVKVAQQGRLVNLLRGWPTSRQRKQIGGRRRPPIEW